MGKIPEMQVVQAPRNATSGQGGEEDLSGGTWDG